MLTTLLLLSLLSQCNSLVLDCLEVYSFNNNYYCNTNGCIYQSTKYNFCKTKHNWHDADAICKNEFNGSLITIANERDLDFINNILSSYNLNLGPLWVGLYSNDNVNWYWTSHGESMPINWQSSKPSGEIIPNCGYILSENNTINNLMADNYCSTNYSFICKYNIPTGLEQVNPLVITVTSTTSTKTTSTATTTKITSTTVSSTVTTKTTSTSSSTAATTSYTTTINTTSSSALLGTTSMPSTLTTINISKSSALSSRNNIIIITTIIIPFGLIILVLLFIRHNRKLFKNQNNVISSQIELYNLESQSQTNSIVENNKLYETAIRVDDKYYDVKICTTNPIYDNSDDIEANTYNEINTCNEINIYDIGANNYNYNNVNFIADEYYDVNVDD